MRSDVVVLGCELDGLVAALRLLRAGCTVRILAGGGGSLHYASGGLHVLGHAGNGQDSGRSPLDLAQGLPERHPYRRTGGEALAAALAWMVEIARSLGLDLVGGERNISALTVLGRSVPVLFPTGVQAAAAMPAGEVLVVRFRGHRDYPAWLLLAALRAGGVPVRLVEAEPPKGARDNAGLAAAFDGLTEPEAYFRATMPRSCGAPALALFPAVLGLNAHRRVVAAAQEALGCPCREVPTLPPSIPGIRLSGALIAAIHAERGLLHMGQRAVSAVVDGRRCQAVVDPAGRTYKAAAFVHAQGGVLMGGLEVGSDGTIREPVFRLPVHQTRPLDAAPGDVPRALHETGIEVDERLRPLSGGGVAVKNLFVTGRMLAHWDPVSEASAEGVSVATGWAAAEAALDLLRGG